MDTDTGSDSDLGSDLGLDLRPEEKTEILQEFERLMNTPKLPNFVNLAYMCQTLYVVGGSGADQTAFRIRRATLETCPVIQNPPVGRWIECPGTEDELPNWGHRRKDLYLETYSSEVVKGVFGMLEDPYKKMPTFLPNNVKKRLNDASYFARFYNLAASLEIDQACFHALDYTVGKTTSEFLVDLLGETETPKIMEIDSMFREWIWAEMKENEKLILQPQCLADATAAIRALFQITTAMESDYRKLMKQKESQDNVLEEFRDRVRSLGEFAEETVESEETDLS